MGPRASCCFRGTGAPAELMDDAYSEERCERLQRQLLQNEIKEARRLFEIETLNSQEEAARQERRSEAAQASLESVERELAELRSGGNSQLMCEWLRLSRDLVCRGRTRDFSPLRIKQEERENRLQNRREKLSECIQAFDELDKTSASTPTTQEVSRPVKELQVAQAELDDLRCGGNRWRDRLQKLLSTMSSSQGLVSSPDGPALCSAEQRLVQLQTQLAQARVEHEAKQRRIPQLQELRKEVIQLEQRLEKAGAFAVSHTSAPPARLPSGKAKPPGPPPRAVTPAKSLPSSRLSLPGGQQTPGSSPPASPGPGKATSQGGPSPARPSTSTPGLPGRIVGPGVPPKGGAPKAKGKPGPPPPPKGGSVAAGKGTGKAKGPGSPGVSCKAMAKKASPEVPRSNGLVNVSWKGTTAPSEADLQHIDSFLSPLCEFSGITNNRKTVKVESAFTGVGVKELTTAELQFWFPAVAQLPKLPRGKGGDASSDGPSPAQSLPSGGTPSSAGQPDLPLGMTRRAILDDRAMKNAELLLQRFRMRRAATAPAVGAALAEELCRSFLQGGLTQESLGAMQTLLQSHDEAGAPLTSFVQANGPEALAFCIPEAEHRLVHAISSVPGHHQRLGCLLFQHSWQEASRKCSEDLEVLHVGLQALSARRKPLQSFFRQAMKLGNAVNQRGGGPVAHNGFKLSSLPTVLQTKSPNRPQLSMLHLVLAQMDCTEVDIISSKLAPLAAARDRKSSGVFERCRELIMGYAKSSKDKAHVKRHMIQGLPERGIGTAVASEASAQPDPEDFFHHRIDAFLAESCQEASRIAQRVREVFRLYWDLAMFFGDPEAVYPPPKSDTDTAQDICLVFYNLGEVVAKVHREVKKMRLREELETAREGGPEAAAAFVEEVHAGGDVPLGLRKASSKTSRSANDVSLPSKELVTVPDAPLMTPPCSPSKIKADSKVVSVASPCRSRASTVSPEKKDNKASLAVRRLKQTAKAQQEEDQSDVSDWESDKQTPATASSSSTAAPRGVSAAESAAALAAVAAGAQAAAAEQQQQRPAARRRRIRLPSERPAVSNSTPPSPSASSHSDLPRAPRTTTSCLRNVAKVLACDPAWSQDGLEDDEQVSPKGASVTPPGTPPQRLGDEPPLERKSEMKMHLSKQANRISSAAIGRLNLPDSPENSDAAWASCSSRPSVCSSMSNQSCQSMSSSSVRSRGSTRLAKAPPPRPPARRSSQTSQASSLSTELKAEVHRRSLSRDSLRRGGVRQRRGRTAPQANLSPVAEPGETPGSERRGAGRKASLQSSGGRQGRLSRDPPPQKPAPRKLWAAFCSSSK